MDDKVAASEAVEIAQELSTVDSSAYINGVLGRVILLKSVISLHDLSYNSLMVSVGQGLRLFFARGITRASFN
ncbi:MAG: transcription antitermination factor NusB [Actinomycetota bacterium]